ncbi:helix-turn-helix domain-containing protein [Heyndrickxia acidicola]|uniref:Helix-turn-helix transcriptional regulator n=1 Tax=Heyndrickxia acidicola TaxID=209389 RepID=A0ABU6MEL4_9BACI|nr:helix-turn-helix transcriptional regulator [Heyndrickxia acidicola]MED1203097.1 helix-turn-helix transcriptional regulator [Heyndrickxia acidicola]
MLERLSELRKNRKWSLQETADQLGIAKSTYAGYESGYREPSLQALSQMADLFQTTVDFILDKTSDSQKSLEVTEMLDRHYNNLLVDGEPLTPEEIIDFVAFVRMKRKMKTEKAAE